jgi:hypothetical protein
MADKDFMEFGDSNLIPIENGWFINKETKFKIDPNGRVFNTNGELIFDPSDKEDSIIEDDEYDWLHKDDK